MDGLDIAVIGSGPGGLSAALFLNNFGHNVTIFEQFKQSLPLGSGLLLQPTGLACLTKIGLDKEIINFWGKNQ